MLWSDGNQPLLIGGAAVRPLDDGRAVGGAATAYVDRFATVQVEELERAVACGGDRPLLVVVIVLGSMRSRCGAFLKFPAASPRL